MSKEFDQSLLLQDIKMLLILQLLREGVRQSHIASILNISEASMSRLLPKGIAKAVLRGKSVELSEHQNE